MIYFTYMHICDARRLSNTVSASTVATSQYSEQPSSMQLTVALFTFACTYFLDMFALTTFACTYFDDLIFLSCL